MHACKILQERNARVSAEHGVFRCTSPSCRQQLWLVTARVPGLHANWQSPPLHSKVLHNQFSAPQQTKGKEQPVLKGRETKKAFVLDMENPSEDIKDVVRELLCKPTPKQQEDTLRRYFKPEARLYNIDLNQEGLDNIIPTYNFALFILNFQDVIFHHILYEQRQNALSLELTVLVRPTTEAFSADNFRVFVLLELEDGRDSRDGRTKKYVKVQRDFFQRDLAIKFLPVIGQVYDSNNLRFLIGRGYAYFFHLLKFGWTTFVPQYLQQVLWEIWIRGPHGPPGECGTDSDKKFAAWVHADDLGDQSTYQPHSIYQPH